MIEASNLTKIFHHRKRGDIRAVDGIKALMTIALWSKTTKEAHSYASPLMLLVLMPAMAAMVPGFDLNAKLALVPVLNVSLVSKEVLTGNYPWLLNGLVFASSCTYAAAALSLAVTAFKHESVLFRM